MKMGATKAAKSLQPALILIIAGAVLSGQRSCVAGSPSVDSEIFGEARSVFSSRWVRSFSEIGIEGFDYPIATADLSWTLFSYPSNVVCLNVATGEVRWKRSVPLAVGRAPVVCDEFIVAAGEVGELTCLDPKTGAAPWAASMRDRIAFIRGKGNTVVVGGESNEIGVLNAGDGAPHWNVTSPGEVADSAIGKNAILIGCDDGDLLAYDLQDGFVLWQQTFRGDIIACVVSEDDIAYSFNVGQDIHALDMRSGRILWRHQVGIDDGGLEGLWPAEKPLLVWGENLLIRGKSPLFSNLRALDGQNGSLIFAVGTARETHPPVVIDQYALVFANDSRALRHSYAMHLLEEGVSIRQIAQYLGHESLGTTVIYTHLTSINEARTLAALETLRKALG